MRYSFFYDKDMEEEEESIYLGGQKLLISYAKLTVNVLTIVSCNFDRNLSFAMRNAR